MKIKVVCQECGKRFKANPDSDVRCPKCGSVDMEVE